jgi:hypothetical protein
LSTFPSDELELIDWASIVVTERGNDLPTTKKFSADHLMREYVLAPMMKKMMIATIIVIPKPIKVFIG